MTVTYLGEEDGYAKVDADGVVIYVTLADKNPPATSPDEVDPEPNDLETPLEAATRWAKAAHGVALTQPVSRDEQLASLFEAIAKDAVFSEDTRAVIAQAVTVLRG